MIKLASSSAKVVESFYMQYWHLNKKTKTTTLCSEQQGLTAEHFGSKTNCSQISILKPCIKLIYLIQISTDGMVLAIIGLQPL